MTKLFSVLQISAKRFCYHQPMAVKQTKHTFYASLVKSLIILIFTFTFPTQMVLGQSVIDYRSKATGDWTTSGTWEFYNGSSWVALGTTLSTDNNAFTTDPSWTNVQISSGLNWIWGSASGNGNGGMSYTNPITTVSSGTWYYKSITLTGGVTYSLTFDYKTSNVTASNSRIIVDISANIPTASTTWTGATELYNALQATSGAWVNNTGTLSFTATTTGTYYLGFRNAYASAAAAITSSIDNITITGTCGIPSSTSGAIAIQSPHIVTVSSDLTVDQVTINSGGTVLLSAGTLSINNGADADDFIIKGTYKRTASLTTIAGPGVVYCDNGGIYEHALNGGIIPTITWNAGSALKITGVAGTMPTATGTYQNVIWNCLSQSGAIGLEDNLNTINGSFTVQSTNLQVLYLGNLGATPRSMAIGGNLNMEGGIFAIRASAFNTSLYTINVAGNYNQTGGNFQLSRTTAGTNIPILNVAGDFTCSGGTLDNNAGANTLSSINFTKSGTQLFTLGGTIANGIEFNVKSGSILEFATATTVLSNSSVNSKFTVESGGGMIIKHAQGISTTASTGCINIGAPTAANYILNTAGNYTFNGSAPQVTGNKFPATVNNFTISNSSGATLTGVLTVNGTLNLSSGNFTSGASNLLTIGSSGTISNASASSYVNGNLARVITGTSATLFPVGKGGNYRPVTFTYTAAPTSKTVTIEQFESGLLSYANTSTARFGARYWNITQSATGIGYSIGLNNSGFTPTGTVVMLRREGTGAVTSNATSFISPTYTNSSSFSTTNVSNDVQLGETAIPLTVSSAAATSKIYDKTNMAVVAGGTLVGIVSGDVVTLTQSGTFASVNVSTGIGVTSTSTLAGANAGAYSLTQPTGLTANITARPLTITGAANSKTFDGNTSSATNPTVTSGVVQSGDVAAFTQTYDNATVGASKVMTPSGIVTDGNSGNNYSYSFATSSNGTITAATSTQWNGSASSNWNTPGNWTPPVVPATGITAVVVTTSTAPIINSSGNECADLIISSGSLTIGEIGTLTVSGTLTNGGTLNILSSADGTGSLLHNTASVIAKVERYMNMTNWTVGIDGWHFLSSPVASQAISPNFTPTDYDFYRWYEPGNVWVNYKNTSTFPTWSDANNSSTDFIVGKGYMAAYADAAPKEFNGMLNVADVDVSGLTITGATHYYAWHLLGNPFACALTWDASLPWGLTNVSGIAKIWNEANQSYSDLTSSPPTSIPATNGFMVEVVSGTGSLTIPAIKRVHDAQAFYKSADVEALKFIARNMDAGNAQECNVVFNIDATPGFDLMYDGEALSGYGPTFYAVAGERKLSTDALPELTPELQVPFNFVPNAGNQYQIDVTGTESIALTAYLLDKKTNTDHNLSLNPTYTFAADAGDLQDRFVLHFSPVGIEDTKTTNNFSAYASDGIINILYEHQMCGKVTVADLAGRIVAASNLKSGSSTCIDMQGHSGIFIVSVISTNSVSNTKIFVN